MILIIIIYKNNKKMPTIFTDCNECNYIECIGLNHKFNNDYRLNLEKQSILISLGIPKEICQKIIKLSYNLTNCSYCDNKLCEKHKILAKTYSGNGWQTIMCNNCFRWVISIS